MGYLSHSGKKCNCKKGAAVTSNNASFQTSNSTLLPPPIQYTISPGDAIPLDINFVNNGKGIVFAPGSTGIGLAANSQYLLVFTVTGTPVLADGGLAVAPLLNDEFIGGLAFQGSSLGELVSASSTAIINTVNGRNIFKLINNNTADVSYALVRMTITQLG